MTTDSFVSTPDDAGNTGKKVRTVTRQVAGQTVVEHVVNVVDGRDILGVYYGHSGLLTLQAAAHGANAGFIYLFNPVGSGVTVSLRRVAYQGAPSSTTARPATRITAERFSFTGTHSGAAIALGKRQTSDATPLARLANNSTGASVTAVGAVQRGFLVPAVPSGNSSNGSSNEMVWEPLNQDGETLIAAGEGILFRQADAGSAGDDRVCLLNLTWAEY